MIAAIATDACILPEPGPAGAAIALQALLPRTTALTAPERALLQQWLGRIADAPPER